MEKFIDYLLEQQAMLNAMEAKANKDKRYLGRIPQGRLSVSKSHGSMQYYIIHEDKRRYIPVKDVEIARKMAQQQYDEKLLKLIKKQQKVIKDFLNRFDAEALQRNYEKLGKARKAIINPLFETDEEYIAKWYRQHPGNQNSYPMGNEYKTNRGEIVRSKSEKILADLFYKMGIPYQYEPRLNLVTGEICPDFVLLHVRKRKTTYWEHFGLTDEEAYATKNFKKLHSYEQSGYKIGEDLLFSMEGQGYPLDIKEVENKLKEWLRS